VEFIYLCCSFTFTRTYDGGDLKVVIDWFEGRSLLNVLFLLTWKQKIMALKRNFSWLKSFHVHHQFNSMADSLSKEAIGNSTGWLHFEV
jgi:hypothetical protein